MSLKHEKCWLIGNYDGFHPGHQALVVLAQHYGKKVGLLTFFPHPRRFFQPDTPSFLLTPNRPDFGVDEVVVLPFDAALAQRSATEFIEKILKPREIECVVIGENFRFGAHRTGNAVLLQEKLAQVIIAPPVLDEQGIPYSSSRVRQALMDGDTALATRLLGRPWSLTGEVIYGAQKGRTIGFPTANIALGEYLRPRFGVYAVTVDGYGAGIANIGVRPTVAGGQELLEVHLFNGNPNLYGQHLAVHLHHFIRPERKFEGLEALKAQIITDCEMARCK